MDERAQSFRLGARFYVIAFLVVFYYFFTRPVNQSNALEIE